MRKIECKKSKHHGFYEEDGACPMCPVPEPRRHEFTVSRHSEHVGEPDEVEELCPEALDIFQRQLDTVMRRVYQGGYNTLSHGQDWGAATGEEILEDLARNVSPAIRK